MATENNNLPVRVYQKQFAGLLSTVFGVQNVFAPTFGSLQTMDGVQNNKTAFSVKTNDVPVVVGEYNTDADVGMGTGTSKSSRFGDMQEIIYDDTDVPYSFTWTFNEGLDKFTVNNDLDAAVANRLALQAEAKTRMFNNKLGAYLVASASGDLGEASDVNKLFETAVERYTELEVVVPIRAYVTADVYNAIIDHNLVTSSKGSAVNIDTNGIVSFRDIVVTKTPAKYMSGKKVIFTPDNIGRAFTGIVTARAIQTPDFDGVALQGSGKAGRWISDDNKKAIFTAGTKSVTPATGISLSQKTASMKVDDTKQVTASAVPADASDAAEVVAAVKWSSSDDTVATVSSDGTISAKAEGTATITATSGSFTATVAVSVSAA